jgi:hypothetical protein
MKKWIAVLIAITGFGLGVGVGIGGGPRLREWLGPTSILTPYIAETPPQPKPLLAYTITTLKFHPYQAREIVIERELSETDEYVSYLFTFQPLGRKMSGQINIPKTALGASAPAIVMNRGYAPVENYYTGFGTKNAAAEFAKAGYVTVAPDWFGFGESDPEPEDTWQGRFEKPIVVVELIKTLREQPIVIPDASALAIDGVGLWGHSNGGQISLTTLAVMSEPIPTTLWAPVTAPFPYSIMYPTYDEADEGKANRKWISLFEREYDVFEFSVTKHLDQLTGPIQIHHGSADKDALKEWSDVFVSNITQENLRREEVRRAQASASATPLATAAGDTPTATPLPEIEMMYYEYPGTDHNLRPNWNTAVERDITFFNQHLK